MPARRQLTFPNLWVNVAGSYVVVITTADQPPLTTTLTITTLDALT